MSWVRPDEISARIGRLRMKYAGDPLVSRIDHNIGSDWSGDPAIFIEVVLSEQGKLSAGLQQLAENLRFDLLRIVRSDEIGLHSYLNFVS